MYPRLQGIFPALCLLGVLSLLQCPFVLCEVCCPTPELKNGKINEQRSSSVSSCDFFNGDTILYTCHEKYQFEARCQADGKWYPKTPTCDESCDFPPTIDHGYYVRTQAFSVFALTEVIYKCDKGYTLVGEARLSCSSSGWSPAAPQCKVFCLKPEIAHGKLSVDKTEYVQAENVNIQCDSGYKLVGPQSITCSESTTWDPEVPKCEWVVPEGCEHMLAGRKVMQCLPNPEDLKISLEMYKLSLEIELLELQKDNARKTTVDPPL